MGLRQIENISGGSLTIYSLGWVMPAAHIEDVDPQYVTDKALQNAQTELDALVAANDLRLIFEDGSYATTSDKVSNWVNIPPPGTIRRSSANITEPGESLIIQVVAGTGVQIAASTGADEGTGVVTLTSDGTGKSMAPFDAGYNFAIAGPDGTEVFMHSHGVFHSEAGWYLPSGGTLACMSINVNEPDGLCDHELILYKDPSTDPVEIATLDLLENNRQAADKYDIVLDPGEYGLAIKKNCGTFQNWYSVVMGLTPEAFYRLDEDPPPSTYTNIMEDITPTTFNSWQTATISGAPASTTVTLMFVSIKKDDARLIGARETGSSLDRRIDMDGPRNSPGETVVFMHVNIDASKQFQVFAESADITVYAVGYWGSGTYVEKKYDFDVTTAATWEDVNLNSEAGSNNIVEVFCHVMDKDTNADVSLGVRENGSSLDRRENVQVAENSNQYRGLTLYSTTDGSGIIEAYNERLIDAGFSLLGYWSVAPDVDHIEMAPTSLGAPTIFTNWEVKDLSAYITANSIAEITISNADADDVAHVGGRLPASYSGGSYRNEVAESRIEYSYLFVDEFPDSDNNGPVIGDTRVMASAEHPTEKYALVCAIDADGHVHAMVDTDGTLADETNLGTVDETFWWTVGCIYNTSTGTGYVVFGDGDVLKYVTWNGTAWSSATTIETSTGNAPRNIHLAADPDGSEMVLVVSYENGTQKAWVWNGTAWANEVTLGTTTSTEITCVDVEYVHLTHRAFVIYGKSSQEDLYYRIWNGTSWSSESTISAPATISGRYTRFATLHHQHGTDNLVVSVNTTSSGGSSAWVSIYNGTSWGNDVVLITTLPINTNYYACDAVFENSSGNVLAVYDKDNKTVKYKYWTSGSGWSAEQSGPDAATTYNVVRMWEEHQENTNYIMLAVQTDATAFGNELWMWVWDGTDFVETTNNDVERSTGEEKNQPFTFAWFHHEASTGKAVSRYWEIDRQKDSQTPVGGSLLVPSNESSEIEWYEDGSGIATIDFKLWGYFQSTVTSVIYDQTTNSHDGTYENNPKLGVTGRISGNAAVQFDGDNDHADVGTWDVSGTGVSLVGWVMLDTVPGVGETVRVIHKGTASTTIWALEIYEGHPQVTIKTSSGDFTLTADDVTLITSTWYLLTATFDETTSRLKLFVNGVKVEDVPAAGTLSTTSDDVIIAARTPSLGLIDGTLDEIIVYNYALSEEEVDDIWDSRDEVSTPTSDFDRVWASVGIIVDASAVIVKPDAAQTATGTSGPTIVES